jgi:hypothetical protein
MSARVHQAGQGPLVRRELPGAVALAGDDEHRDPRDQGRGNRSSTAGQKTDWVPVSVG